MNIIRHRKIFYIFSAVLLAASVAAIAVWGLTLGIDFTGGSLLEVEFLASRPTVPELERAAGSLDLGEIRFQPIGERGLLIRLRHISEAEHQAVLLALRASTELSRMSRAEGLALSPAGSGIEGVALDPLGGGAIEKRFNTVGPTIGRELAQRSLLAIGLVILLIVSYIAWVFRKVSAPVALGRPAGLASWKYGLVTVVALIHDILIPAGIFAIYGRFAGYEVDTLFVTALLTILGFSVHDTIVVFDRIRENLRKQVLGEDFEAVVNASITQTFGRSLNTSLTVVLALLGVYLFGGETTRVFALTLIIGIIIGTYSSIFIASPLLVSWHSLRSKGKYQNAK